PDPRRVACARPPAGPAFGADLPGLQDQWRHRRAVPARESGAGTAQINAAGFRPRPTAYFENIAITTETSPMKFLIAAASTLMTVSLSSLPGAALAADYPQKPVQIIVPYAVGGP